MSHPPDTTGVMDSCCCPACLENQTIAPADYIDPVEWAYEMAAEACWDDMADYQRDYL